MYITGEVVILEVDGHDIRVQSYVVRVAPDLMTSSLSSLSVSDDVEGSAGADQSSSKKGSLIRKWGNSPLTRVAKYFSHRGSPPQLSMVNPLTCKRENKIALGLAIAVGFIFGCSLAAVSPLDFRGYHFWIGWCYGWNEGPLCFLIVPDHLRYIAFFGVLGATACGLPVYIFQLFRF